MRLHPIRPNPARAVRYTALAAAAAIAFALSPPTCAQVGSDLWFAHRVAATDAAVRGPLAGLRLAQLARAGDDAPDAWDNAHVTLTEDEARADADLRMAVAVVQLSLPVALLRQVPAPCGDVHAAPLTMMLPADATDWARLTVRLATQPGVEFDVGVLGATSLVVRDARLRGAGGSANLSAQTDVVELEWRQGGDTRWASVQIGMQSQGVVAARLVASIGL